MKNNCDFCNSEYEKIKPWQRFCCLRCKDKEFHIRNPDAKVIQNRKSSKTPNFKFHVHKNGAKRREIGFFLTFDEWWEYWEPYWENRGRGKDSLVMCRKNDCGDYTKGNVFIGTVSENSRFAARNKPALRDKNTGRFT